MISDFKVEMVNDRDASDSHETIGDSKFSVIGETYAGPESSCCLAPCPVCVDDSQQLLACLHSVCLGRPSGGQGQHQEPGVDDPELQGCAGAVQECCPYGSGGEAQPKGACYHGEATAL